MRKNFTYLFVGFFLFSLGCLNGQTVVWPTADSATIRASQFSDTTTIFRATAANPNPPAGFKGWISKGVSGTGAVKDNTHWDWSKDGRGNKGTLWGTRLPVTSPNAANGAAIFNSDFLDSNGNGSYGMGAAPGSQKSDLWSPVMDMTGKNDLTVTFGTYFRRFNVSLTGVSWSEDGGTTWKDTFFVKDNMVLTSYQSFNGQTAVKLKGSKGTANFRIKFIFNGYYYFWIVDDVKVVQMDNNLRANKDWFAIPQNLFMPRHLIDTVYFMSDIENLGNKNASNAKLTVNIKNASNVSVYSFTKNFGTIAPDALKENEVIGGWLPSAVGSGTVAYSGTYVVSSDSTDMFAANDTIKFNFALTDSLAMNENATNYTENSPAAATWGANEPHNWKVGNYFYFPKGSKTTATRIRAIVDSTSIRGQILGGGLYEWNDANNDRQVQETERTLIAFGEATVPSSGTTAEVVMDFKLENIGSGPIVLKDNQAYLAMLEFVTTKKGIDMQVEFSDDLPYEPMIYATGKIGRPRYTTVINYNGSNTSPWYMGTFRGDDLQQLTPLVRMWSWPIKTDTKEPLSSNNKIELYPNPAQNTLNVSFDLEKVESAVLVRIIDMQGRILKERDYDNVQKDNIPFDISSLQNGIYNVQIQTIGNYRTMRLVIAK